MSGLIKMVGGVDTGKVGVYELFYSVKDSQGNAATQVTRRVEVRDTKGPVINLKGEVSVTHEAGSSYKDAGASAVDVVDGDLSLEIDIVSTVNTRKPGVYRVSYGVSDVAGNKANAVVRTVKVEDTTGPVITLNGDEVVKHEAGGSYKDGGASATDLVDGDLSGVVEVLSTVDASKPGSYTVSYGVSDTVGNKAKGLVRTVKVQDTTGPVIKLKGEAFMTHEAGSSYTDKGASAVDVVDGDLSEEVNVVSTVDVSKPGDYTVSYGVSDAAGNKAKEAVRKVKVQDSTGPVITLKGEALEIYEAGSSYTDMGASATDNLDGDLTGEINVVSTVNSVKPGNYTVNYGVSDAEGNKTTAIRKVTIVDTTSPVIKLAGEALVTHEAGSSYADLGATANDLVDGDLSGNLEVESTVNIGKPGVYTVSYGVSDAVGNKAKAVVRKVSVVDTTGPVVTLNGGEVVTHEAGGLYKDGGASAADVVDGTVSVQTSGDVNSNKPGSYTLGIQCGGFIG